MSRRCTRAAQNQQSSYLGNRGISELQQPDRVVLQHLWTFARVLHEMPLRQPLAPTTLTHIDVIRCVIRHLQHDGIVARPAPRLAISALSDLAMATRLVEQQNWKTTTCTTTDPHYPQPKGLRWAPGPASPPRPATAPTPQHLLGTVCCVQHFRQRSALNQACTFPVYLLDVCFLTGRRCAS